MLLTIFSLSFFSNEILKAYAGLFRIDNATKGADCVLILSGNANTRPDQAAYLIQNSYSNRLYHTDQRRQNFKHQDILGHPFDKAQKILKTYHLKADIIPSTKGGATSTFDEAHDFALFLKDHPMQHVILVTDSFHTARAHYAFRKVLDINGYENIRLEMSAASNEVFNESSWYKSEKGLTAYILEPIKYLFYLFHTDNTSLIKEG